MFVYERTVRFHEVDAAGLLFFPWFFSYAHEAMEAWCGALDGGYARLILQRRVGLPAVALASEFVAPLRYGDAARVELGVSRLGNRSLTLEYRFRRRSDGESCATISHTVVCTDLDALASTDMPADLRELAAQHLRTSSG